MFRAQQIPKLATDPRGYDIDPRALKDSLQEISALETQKYQKLLTKSRELSDTFNSAKREEIIGQNAKLARHLPTLGLYREAVVAKLAGQNQQVELNKQAQLEQAAKAKQTEQTAKAKLEQEAEARHANLAKRVDALEAAQTKAQIKPSRKPKIPKSVTNFFQREVRTLR